MGKLSLLIAAAAASLIVAAPAAAHPEDEFGGSISRGPSTSELAQAAIEKLVAQKKLPASWTNAKLAGFDYRTKNGTDQYVLTYENAAIKQPSKRKLYVLMSASGEFISAGYKLT
jgi:Family of unknown function (DUF6488)